MREKVKKGFEHWQVVMVYLMLYDAIAINLSYFLALWLRFDCRYTAIPSNFFYSFLKFAPIYTVFSLVIFWLLRMYKSIWRFASYNELLRVTASTAITAVFHGVFITVIFGRMPISYYLIGAVIQFILVLAVRFSYRFILFQRSLFESAKAKSDANIMIIGAGNAGRMIIQDLIHSDRSDGNVVCIIDDNRNKWDRYIEGIPVVGGRDSILSAVEKYKVKKIFFAIPSASADEKKELLNLCHETGCELKSLPGIYQIANGEVNVTDLKDVAIEDLLGREIIKLDLEPVYKMLTGKTVMVTGGGGSIGSELCRQIASHDPKQLIIFDVYENNAYAIQQELISKYPNLNLVVLIGSVRDSGRLQDVFSTYKPQIVYHAAAHKHVPLMEVSPCEAIKNNAIGTYKTAYAAMRNGCERFVLISTDKAVNPTNIMGASKRLCEMIIQTFDYMVKNHRENDIPRLHAHQSDGEWDIPYSDEKIVSHTRFCAVRFGNVLGSNGSVIPLFKQQIAQGGPVKVTHPDIIRYFMLIPEAVSLVLQASVMGKGSEIYVLDMGEPVKIDTLARNLIRLSGKVPDVDIKIEYIGYRIVIPLKEMVIGLPNNLSGQAYSDMITVQHKRLSRMLGAEIDFVIRGIDSKTRSIVASRREAMLKKRQTFYMTADENGTYRIYDGRIVQARVIMTSEKAIRVEAFGVECNISARDLSWDWIGDAQERFSVGDQVLVRIQSINREDVENISIKADIKSVSENRQNNLNLCRVQGKYAGKVTDVHKGVVYIRLTNGVNAIAHSCYDRRMPGKKDDVSFAVTHLDEDQGVALGIITRIIKQNL